MGRNRGFMARSRGACPERSRGNPDDACSPMLSYLSSHQARPKATKKVTASIRVDVNEGFPISGSSPEKTILGNYGSRELLRRSPVSRRHSLRERAGASPRTAAPSHQGRSVGAHEFPWVELVFEALNRLPRNVRSSRCVDNNIFVGCFYPDDLLPTGTNRIRSSSLIESRESH